MKIDRVEVRVVGPKIKRFTWSHDIPEQYMTNTIARIFTDEGGAAPRPTTPRTTTIVTPRRRCAT